MKRVYYILISIFFIQISMASQVFADDLVEIDGYKDKIDLLYAWQMGLSNHEAVAVAKELSLRNRLDVSRAYSQILPSLKADGSYTRYTEEKSSATGFSIQPEDSSRVELRLYQPIYSGGRAKSTLSQAKKMRLSGELGVDDAREEVLILTARAYYGLLQADKAVNITRTSVERLKEHRRVSEKRLNIGVGTRADLLRAEAELASRAADVVEAEGYLSNAEDLFRRMTGLKGKEDVVLAPPVPNNEEGGIFTELVSTADLDVEDAVAVALKNRGDYRRSVLDEGVAGDGVRYAKGGFLPTVSIEGVHVMRGQTPETSFFLDEVTYGVVNVSVPIFEGGLRRADLSKARSVKRQAEITRIALRRDIELELRRAYNEMVTTASRVEAYAKQFDFAKLNYDTVFKQYEHGLASSTDLIDGDSTLVSAELQRASSELANKLSILEVMRSLGILLSEVEGHINGAK